jgi:IS605 OrfB family transposase
LHKTYQTKLFKVTGYPTNNLAVTCLNDWSEYFQSIERKLFVDIVHRKTPLSILKKRYIEAYGITARQFNSIRAQLQGKISSVNELKKAEYQNKTYKLRNLEDNLVILLSEKKSCINSLENTKLDDKKFPKIAKNYKKLKHRIHHTKRKVQSLKHDLSLLKSDMDKDTVRICFGSRALFSKQFNLKENGFESHSEWKEKWIHSRSNQFMCLGSSDETFGNQNCQYDNDNIDRCKGTYEGYTKGGNQQRYHNEAMTHRFYRNEFGWYLYTSVDVENAPIATDSRIGAIGSDFNVNFAQVCFVDRFGNPLDELSIKYSMYGKKSGQIDAMLGDMARDMCELGRYYRVPIFIENLGLENAKKSLDNGPKYNRMIHSFPYKKFRDALESRGKKTGVEIATVNPSYTSVIGQFKFMKKYGLSSHGSAACVIARRGLNLKTERLSKRNKSYIRHSSVNIDLNKNNYRLWTKLSSAIKKRYKFNDRIYLLYAGVL